MEFDNIDKSVRKKQGNIGVSRAIYEYSKLGFTILLPFSDSDKYDLVIERDGKLLRVQIKTSTQVTKYGTFPVEIKTTGGNTKRNTIRNREDDDYDLLFILLENGRCWSIPANKLESRTSLIVGKKYAEFEIGGPPRIRT